MTGSPRSLVAAREAEPLPILLMGHQPVLSIERRVVDDQVEVLEIPAHRFDAAGTRQRFHQTRQGRTQTAHDLYGSRTILANLIEREGEIILPSRKRKHEANDAVRVCGAAGVQVVFAEAAQ